MKIAKMLVAGLLAALSVQAQAALIQFVPPNDTTGAVFTTNNNDGWDLGRGIVFQATSNMAINSIGLFHDLTGINLFYEFSQVTAPTGQVSAGQTVLASGSTSVTTRGLQWIDVGIPDQQLTAGKYYHLEFTFTGLGNQNFFYNNLNAQFSQGPFALLEGTQSGNTTNFVLAGLRLNTVEAQAVPEPGSVALLAIGIAGLLLSRKKSRA